MNQAGSNMGKTQVEFANRIPHKSRELEAGLRGQYDYIVSRKGSSGSVVVGRLAADPVVRVVLLKAGASDDVDTVMDPNQMDEGVRQRSRLGSKRSRIVS
jgi:choline dehydrogenase